MTCEDIHIRRDFGFCFIHNLLDIHLLNEYSGEIVIRIEFHPVDRNLIIPKEQIRILVSVHNVGKIHKLKVHTADVIAALHFRCKPFDSYGIGSRI